MVEAIAGYTYGQASVAPSPVTDDDLALLQATVLWTDADDDALRMAGDVLGDQVEQILDVWYGYVAAHPHLVYYFSDAEGQPDTEYLTRVRARFAQWIRDVCTRPRDRSWLDYQEEIALRHVPARKNVVDAASSPPLVPVRYLVAFIYPITATMRPFLAAKGHSAEQVEAMHQAWFKSVVLSVVLWTRPYAEAGW